MAHETEEALQNLGILNKQFSDALSPFNNFSAQNLQLSVAKERAMQEQNDKLQQLQFASQLEMRRQEAQNQASLHLATVRGDADHKYAVEVEKMRLEHEDNKSVKAQADQIRMNQTARRVIGSDIGRMPDTPEGNRALVARYTQAFADPKVAENLDTEEATTITKNLKDAVSQLTSNVTNSPQSRQAILNFLKTPGVTDLLIRKGKLSPQDINQLAQGGDISKVSQAITQTAKEATLLWGSDDKVASQLVTALNQALSDAGATPSPEQTISANYISDLMNRRKAIFDRGNITSPESYKKISDVGGYTPKEATKLPSPPVGAGVQTPTVTNPNVSPTEPNPFPQPAVPVAEQKSGPLVNIWNGLVNAKNAGIGMERGLADPDPRQFALDPTTKIANDPATEYAIRKHALDTYRTRQAAVSGLTSVIPGISNYQPSYTPYTEDADEQNLKRVVMGLYSPQNQNPQISYPQFGPPTGAR